MAPRPIDITGHRSGRLVAVAKSGRDHRGKTQWLCNCDCGAQTTLRVDCISTGQIKSCGCLGIESARNVAQRRTLSIESRFWAMVVKKDGCWDWAGTTNGSGYPRIGVGGKRGGMRTAHRLSWEINVGPIPDGLHVLHHCDNKRCTNPAHLYVGTRSDNMRDMWKRIRRVAA